MMSRQHHKLKCETGFYQDVEIGRKTFEIRLNDRDFKLGDMIELNEVVNGARTGRKLQPVEITYILYHHQFKHGLKKDYCILGFEKIFNLFKTRLQKY